MSLMNTYTPLFSQIVDSSIWCESDIVCKVFLTLLAKQDADHVVRGTAFNISIWARKTEQEVIDALAVLGSPDTKRLEPQPFNGSGDQKVEDAWLFLTGGKYQQIKFEGKRRA